MGKPREFWIVLGVNGHPKISEPKEYRPRVKGGGSVIQLVEHSAYAKAVGALGLIAGGEMSIAREVARVALRSLGELGEME